MSLTLDVSSLKGFQVYHIDENCLKGWVANHNDLEKVIELFERATLTSFVAWHDNEKSRGRNPMPHKPFWQHMDIPYQDAPFIVTHTVKRMCEYGKDRCRLKSREREEDHTRVIKRRRRRSSRKVGCTAGVTIRYTKRFEHYSVKSPCKNEGSGRRSILEQLGSDLAAGSVPFTWRIYVSFPLAHENHSLSEEAARFHRLDIKLRTKIHQLVRGGLTSLALIQSSLKTYVEEELCAGEILPNPCDGRYYPTRKCIANHVRFARAAGSFSTVNLMDLDSDGQNQGTDPDHAQHPTQSDAALTAPAGDQDLQHLLTQPRDSIETPQPESPLEFDTTLDPDDDLSLHEVELHTTTATTFPMDATAMEATPVDSTLVEAHQDRGCSFASITADLSEVENDTSTPTLSKSDMDTWQKMQNIQLESSKASERAAWWEKLTQDNIPHPGALGLEPLPSYVMEHADLVRDINLIRREAGKKISKTIAVALQHHARQGKMTSSYLRDSLVSVCETATAQTELLSSFKRMNALITRALLDFKRELAEYDKQIRENPPTDSNIILGRFTMPAEKGKVASATADSTRIHLVNSSPCTTDPQPPPQTRTNLRRPPSQKHRPPQKRMRLDPIQTAVTPRPPTPAQSTSLQVPPNEHSPEQEKDSLHLCQTNTQTTHMEQKRPTYILKLPPGVIAVKKVTTSAGTQPPSPNTQSRESHPAPTSISAKDLMLLLKNVTPTSTTPSSPSPSPPPTNIHSSEPHAVPGLIDDKDRVSFPKQAEKLPSSPPTSSCTRESQPVLGSVTANDEVSLLQATPTSTTPSPPPPPPPPLTTPLPSSIKSTPSRELRPRPGAVTAKYRDSSLKMATPLSSTDFHTTVPHPAMGSNTTTTTPPSTPINTHSRGGQATSGPTTRRCVVVLKKGVGSQHPKTSTTH